MNRLEQVDRRAFLGGLTLTSAGLFVPRPAQIAVPMIPELVELRYDRGYDMGQATYLLANGSECVEEVHIDDRVHLLKRVLGLLGAYEETHGRLWGDSNMVSITYVSELRRAQFKPSKTSGYRSRDEVGAAEYKRDRQEDLCTS